MNQICECGCGYYWVDWDKVGVLSYAVGTRLDETCHALRKRAGALEEENNQLKQLLARISSAVNDES